MKIQKLAPFKISFAHPARMAIAAAIALLAARVLGLREVYWAPVAALIVVQSDSNAMLATSWLLLVGTAVGVCAGALLATYIGPHVIVFALGVLGMGLLSATLRLDRRANHFAAIALIIVLLAGPANQAWLRALHRFIEFSIGIVMALLLSALWPCQQTSQVNGRNQKH
ncbi:MAG: FUSC family protein [Verrucomicrobiota bacterium]|jgi:uncharacterized membrane protein YgaE (UPF0421/DUF939 family)